MAAGLARGRGPQFTRALVCDADVGPEWKSGELGVLMLAFTVAVAAPTGGFSS
jgi:hypothetical protein